MSPQSHPSASRWGARRGARWLGALAVVAAGCGGGSSTDTATGGGFSLHARWEQARSTRAPTFGGGFGAILPASVRTVVVLFESLVDGERRCVAVDARSTPIDAASGQHLVVLQQLTAGPGMVRVVGFPLLQPAAGGDCAALEHEPASYVSEPQPVVVVADTLTDAGDIDVYSVPFLVQRDPEPNGEARNPVAISLAVVDAVHDIDVESIVIESPPGSGVETRATACRDGSEMPCSSASELEVDGFIVTTREQSLALGSAQLRVEAYNQATPARRFVTLATLDGGSVQYAFTVLPALPSSTATVTESPTMSLTATPTPGGTRSPTATITPSATLPRPTQIPTSVPTSTPTAEPSASPSALPTKTPTSVATGTPTSTATLTTTATFTCTVTPTETATLLPSETATATPTDSQTATATTTATSTPEDTPTATATSTQTTTRTATDTPTGTATHTPTTTSTQTATASNTATRTATRTLTSTPTATSTSTRTPSGTRTATATSTATPTPTSTQAFSGVSCAEALPIAALPYKDMRITQGMPFQPPVPMPSCYSGPLFKAVWYAYTAATDATLYADNFGSNPQTVLAVYRSPCAMLSEVACNAGGVTGLAFSSLSFVPNAGATYYFVASTPLSGGGESAFELSLVPVP